MFHMMRKESFGLILEWFDCVHAAQDRLNSIPLNLRCNLTPIEPIKTSPEIWRICYFDKPENVVFLDWK